MKLYVDGSDYCTATILNLGSVAFDQPGTLSCAVGQLLRVKLSNALQLHRAPAARYELRSKTFHLAVTPTRNVGHGFELEVVLDEVLDLVC
jgi:hypothetical protein